MQTHSYTEEYQNVIEQKYCFDDTLQPKSVDVDSKYPEDVADTDSASSLLDENHSKEDLLVDFGDTPLKDSTSETNSILLANGSSSLLLNQMLSGEFSSEPTLLDLTENCAVSNCEAPLESVKDTSASVSESNISTSLLDQILSKAPSTESTLLDLAVDTALEDKELENYLEELENEDIEETKEAAELIQQNCNEDNAVLSDLIKEDISKEFEDANYEVTSDNSLAIETCPDNEPLNEMGEFVLNSEAANDDAAEENTKIDYDAVSETQATERSYDSDAVSETQTTERSFDSDAVSETQTERSFDSDAVSENEIIERSGDSDVPSEIETTERSLESESQTQDEIPQTSHTDTVEDLLQPSKNPINKKWL